MAGNKALKKFLESKIPKKGQAKPLKEINVYKEPNTSSEIIGKIKVDQEVNWISKSICDDREWMRCDQNQNFGYVIGHDKDGSCNFDVGKIKIKEEPAKKPQIFVKNDKLTDEDIKLGEEALNEILGEEDNSKNCNDISNQSDKSTDGDNNSIENTTNHIDLDDKYDYFDDVNWNNINFELENDYQIKKANDILNEIIIGTEKEQKPKIIEIKKDGQKDNNKKQEDPNTFKRILSSIEDLLPPDGNAKPGSDSMAGFDSATNEKLTKKEQLMKALSKIPGINYASKGQKISKSLSVTNKAGKETKASKDIKNDEKKTEKKDKKKPKKDKDKNFPTIHDGHNKGNPHNVDSDGEPDNLYYYHSVQGNSRKDAYNKALKDGFGNRPIDHGDHFHQSRIRDGKQYKYGNTHYTWGKSKDKKDKKYD
jgi:hypothetical protein